MSCFATANQPPHYIEYEGTSIVGITPPDPSKCAPLPWTLEQLQEQNCDKQGLVWDGQQCTPRRWYQQSWVWLLILGIIFALAMVLSVQRQSPQNKFARYPLG